MYARIEEYHVRKVWMALYVTISLDNFTINPFIQGLIMAKKKQTFNNYQERLRGINVL